MPYTCTIVGVSMPKGVTKHRTDCTGPKIGIFWAVKEDCFRCTFSQSAIGRFSWISWIVRWHTVHTDSQLCSEPRPQTASAKATGGRHDYHDFEAPLLTMLLALAGKQVLFGGRCRRCGVSWHRMPNSCRLLPSIFCIFCTYEPLWHCAHYHIGDCTYTVDLDFLLNIIGHTQPY